MIDWKETNDMFNYSSISDIGNVKRPKVVCSCDTCQKKRVITIRVKSRIVDEQMAWKCPSCVALGRSNTISQQMKSIWTQTEYRESQIDKKLQDDYKENQSNTIKQLWTTNDYSSKLKIGIRTEDFVKKCERKFKGQFIYDISSFRDWLTKITITCTICGSTFRRKPHQHLNIGYCPTCNTSLGQREIAEHIGQHTPITLNDRSILNGKELDITTKNGLAVEYHGLYWHSYNIQENKEQIFRHQNKALECMRAGITLLQFFDYEWNHKQDIVKSIINNKLGLSKQLNARSLELRGISGEEAADFFTKSHLQGYRPAKITLGLCDSDGLKIAASFSKYSDGYEIIRLATKNGYNVRGGASRLIANFMKISKASKLYTFADLKISTANVYQKLGFKLLHISKPGYFYYKNKLILSRQQCQKHKLKALLGNGFDPSLSEPQNMFMNGYRRVWNAGNIKLVLNKYIINTTAEIQSK